MTPYVKYDFTKTYINVISNPIMCHIVLCHVMRDYTLYYILHSAIPCHDATAISMISCFVMSGHVASEPREHTLKTHIRSGMTHTQA